MPSRTSILVAAVRAFGSREPDESVRNPDWVANLLIGPSELSLISDHPVSVGLAQDYKEASQDADIMLFASVMLQRTRYIDEALSRAISTGARQVVVLGAGFDSRVYRFSELLKNCSVIEVDAAPTQAYKKRRVQEVLQDPPKNLAYCPIDLAEHDLIAALCRAGYRRDEKAFYIWEGVCMYLHESSVRKTLHTIASHSAPGSTLVLDYANALAIALGSRIPKPWAEPWIFGVPGTNGTDFFRELGFDPGVPVAANSLDLIRRYGTRQDGTNYVAHVLEKLEARAESVPQGERGGVTDLQQAVAAAGGTYWFTELAVHK